MNIGRIVVYNRSGIAIKIATIVQSNQTYWYCSHGERFPRSRYRLASDEEVESARESFRNRALGVKREEWKQNNPHDQMAVVLWSLEGHIDLQAELNRPDFLEKVKTHVEQLKELLSFLGPGEWPCPKDNQSAVLSPCP